MTIHESDDWDTVERLEFIRYHPCVSVLIDRFKAAPADFARPADGVDIGSLAEPLDEARDESRPP